MHLDHRLPAVAVALLTGLVVHEMAHAFAALRLGDPTARDAGRLRPNPLRHLDPLGSLLVPGVLLLLGAAVPVGWARPAPVTPARLRRPVNGVVAVALAGPLAHLLLALALAALARACDPAGPLAALRAAAVIDVEVNVALALFHLVPIPPLDGSWVLMRFLPMRHILALRHFRWPAAAALVLLATSPVFSGAFVLGPFRAVVRGCLAVAGVPAAEAAP